MKNKFASFISFIGHPLLTLSFFAITAFFCYESFHTALCHSLLILLGIFFPLTIKMYRNSKKGTYTNFDVSDKAQRQSWYIYAILVLLIVSVILFVTDQPRVLRFSVVCSLVLLAVSSLLNYIIKSSLHVSFAIFLFFLILPMNEIIAGFFFCFTFLIAWSRIALKRHTMNEIIVGVFIGLSMGIFYWYCIH